MPFVCTIAHFSQENGCYKHSCYLLAVIYVSIVSRSHAVQDRRSLSQGELKTRPLQEVIHQRGSHTLSRFMDVVAQQLCLRLAARVEQYLCPLFVQQGTFHRKQGCYKHGRHLLAVIYATIVSGSLAISFRHSLSQGVLKTRPLQVAIHGCTLRRRDSWRSLPSRCGCVSQKEVSDIVASSLYNITRYT